MIAIWQAILLIWLGIVGGWGIGAYMMAQHMAERMTAEEHGHTDGLGQLITSSVYYNGCEQHRGPVFDWNTDNDSLPPHRCRL